MTRCPQLLWATCARVSPLSLEKFLLYVQYKSTLLDLNYCLLVLSLQVLLNKTLSIFLISLLLCTERLQWGPPEAFFSPGSKPPTLSAFPHRWDVPAFWRFPLPSCLCLSCTVDPSIGHITPDGVSPEQSKRGEPPLLTRCQHIFRYTPGYSWLSGRWAHTLPIYISFFIHQYSLQSLSPQICSPSLYWYWRLSWSRCKTLHFALEDFIVVPWSHSNPPKCLQKASLLSSQSTSYFHVIHKLAKGGPDLIIYKVNEDIKYCFSQYWPLGDITCHWSPLGYQAFNSSSLDTTIQPSPYPSNCSSIRSLCLQLKGKDCSRGLY